MKIPPFLKLEGDSLIFNVSGELVFYVPEKYFDKDYAIISGECISLIGIFSYAIFNDSGKHNGLKPFNLPTVFLTKPGKTEKIKNVKLTSTSKEQDYRLLKYKKGDVVIVSYKVPKIVDNAEDFYRMYLYGDLPSEIIRYDEGHNLFDNNLELNGKKYGINKQLFGIIWAQQCRTIDDPTKLFRHTDMKNIHNYQMIDIKQAPKYTSVHSAFTSENFDDSIVNAIVNKNNNSSSPLEKLLTSE